MLKVIHAVGPRPYTMFFLNKAKWWTWGHKKYHHWGFCRSKLLLLAQPASVRVCVHPSTLSNINISETSWPIIIKFHQEHHLGGGFTVLGFWLDRIRTQVFMATDSSHRVIMGKIL